MSLRYYMDHHVPARITEGLRLRQIDCLTAEEDQTSRIADDRLLIRATALERVVFTMDVDFLGICATFWSEPRDFSGVVYARQLGITIGQAVRDLQLMSEVLDPTDMRNQLYRLPL